MLSQRDSNPSAQGCEARATLGYLPRNFSTLTGLHPIRRQTRFNREPCEIHEIKTKFPFAYLAYFAVRLPLLQLLQSCFHFARSPSVVAPLQRWAEGCNRVAVGARLCPAPSGISRSTFANPRRKIFSTASAPPSAATGPADTVALRPKAP